MLIDDQQLIARVEETSFVKFFAGTLEDKLEE